MKDRIKDRIKELLQKIAPTPPSEEEELGYAHELRVLVEDLLAENKILDLMVKTSDAATEIINDQNLHRLMLEFYDMFTEHFAPEDHFKIDVDFDPEDEINEDRVAITVLTRTDNIGEYSDKRFLVHEKLTVARKLLAPECKHLGFYIEYVG